MRVYSYSEARQQLAELLNRARREGQVEIRRRDGQTFVVRPTAKVGSLLDVPGVDSGLTREDLVALVQDSRQSAERFVQGKTPPAKRWQPKARRGTGKPTTSRARRRG